MNELSELYGHYRDNVPDEFKPKDQRKFIDVECKIFDKNKSFVVKLKSFMNPIPKIDVVTNTFKGSLYQRGYGMGVCL